MPQPLRPRWTGTIVSFFHINDRRLYNIPLCQQPGNFLNVGNVTDDDRSDWYVMPLDTRKCFDSSISSKVGGLFSDYGAWWLFRNWYCIYELHTQLLDRLGLIDEFERCPCCGNGKRYDGFYLCVGFDERFRRSGVSGEDDGR